MYTRLTKTINVDGRDCVSCIYCGTEKCRIHSGLLSCMQCDVFAAILNQLHALEDIICEEQQGAGEK